MNYQLNCAYQKNDNCFNYCTYKPNNGDPKCNYEDQSIVKETLHQNEKFPFQKFYRCLKDDRGVKHARRQS